MLPQPKKDKLLDQGFSSREWTTWIENRAAYLQATAFGVRVNQGHGFEVIVRDTVFEARSTVASNMSR